MEARSALVVGFIGILVVGAMGIEAKGEEEPPAEASITANLTGDQWSGHFNSVEHLRVAMVGEPGDGETSLVDPTGLHIATAVAVPNSECAGEPLRSTGIGSNEWCLRLSGLDVGAEMTGKVEGDPDEGEESSTLSLKVTERYHFLGVPLLVVALGILLSLLWTFAISRGLPSWIPYSRLRRALKKNESAKTKKNGSGKTERIGGLRSWSKSVSRSKGAGAVLLAIAEIESTGIAQADNARAALAAAIKKSSLPSASQEHPLLTEARKEANRSDHQINDFFGEDGQAKDEHPAIEHGKLLARAEKLLRRMSAAVSDIDTRVPGVLRADLHAKSALVRDAFNRANDSDALGESEIAIGRLEDRVFEAVRATEQVKVNDLRAVFALTQDLPAFVAAEPEMPAPATTVPGLDVEVAGWKLGDVTDVALASGGVLLVLGLIQTIVAVYTVAVSVYWPNLSFGAKPDWLALFAASFASSSAAAIVGLAAIGETKKATA